MRSQTSCGARFNISALASSTRGTGNTGPHPSLGGSCGKGIAGRGCVLIAHNHASRHCHDYRSTAQDPTRKRAM
ncbi:unnamed protein product [Peniophora sp. CBMAI 1063]|nr:unnamed protein product [Peniophora sp. CBMAI 1063]